MNLLDTYAFAKDVRRRSEAMGVQVVFEDGLEVPYVKDKTVHLPRPNASMNADDFAIIKGASIHEPLHIIRNGNIQIGIDNKIDPDGPEWLLYNLIEDEFMEFEQARRYRGDALDLGAMREVSARRKLPNLERADWDKVDPNMKKMMACAALTCEARADWDRIGTIHNKDILHTFDKETLTHLDKLLDAGLIDDIREGGDEQASYEVSQKIWNTLWTEDEQEELKQQMADEAEDEGGEQGDGEGEQQSGGGNKKGEGNEEGLQQPRELHWDDILNSQHNDKRSNSPLHISYEGVEAKGFQYYPDTHHEVRDGKRLDYNDSTYKEAPPSDWRTCKVGDKAFANQVRRLIQSKMKARFESERTTGKIHSRNLYRVGVPMVGDGEWNRKIFKRRVETTAKNTAVSIVVDWSGSMGGHKMTTAVQAAQRLNEVFSHALNLPLEIIAFTTGYVAGGVGPIEGIIKDFGERRITNDRIVDRLNNMYSSGNADADSVMFSYDRLIQRNEKRKIMIVLSDGQPVQSFGYSVGGADRGLKDTIAGIQKARKVEVHGIGIQDVNVRRYYGKNARVINELEQLNPALLETLSEALFR